MTPADTVHAPGGSGLINGRPATEWELEVQVRAWEAGRIRDMGLLDMQVNTRLEVPK